MPIDVQKLVQVLLEAARAAGEAAADERTFATVSFKPAATGANPHALMSRRILTSGDFAAQEAVLARFLAAGLRECKVHAEEESPSLAEFRPRNGAPVLFVDPIDGTLSYAVGTMAWEDTAIGVGFAADAVARIKSRIDPKLYGVVLGAQVPGVKLPGAGLVSVCALPALGIVYHSVGGRAFRNGRPLRVAGGDRPSRVVLAPRLLDLDGNRASHFDAARLPYRVAASHPSTLWRLFEGDTTAYAGLANAFDGQLASEIAAAAGLVVSDRRGRDFFPADLTRRADSLILATSPEERNRVAAVLRLYR
ncbi:MAG: hypothetical protein HYZ53_29190 [Planctomycetes bacterium]|nr:hypothetical protein [Planctomycetota bacterium]